MAEEQERARTKIEEHFDIEAARYDYWKTKNWYYYDALKDIARVWTEGSASILDAGCGTGTIISTLSGKERVGIDISSEMIEIAKKRYASTPGLSFVATTIEAYDPKRTFERVLCFDVIEHLEHYPEAIQQLARVLAPKGFLVLSMANPLWEPILLVAEKLKMKMPEGPHVRISEAELLAVAKRSGLTLFRRDFRLLFPKHIPGFSYVMNNILAKLPVLRRLCVIEVFIFNRAA